MQIEMIPAGEIRPYEKNAKEHTKKQVEQIAASIREFGFQQPLVLDAGGEIIVGHGRFLGGQAAGMTEFPCVRAKNLTPEQIAAYRLADNKLNESKWDMKLALPELKELDLKGFNIELTGFKRDLILDVKDEVDDLPMTPETAVVQRGEIWALGDHRLMCGSSTERADVDALMAGTKARMTFTDPPWNVAIGGDGNPRHRQREGLINDNMTSGEFRNFLRLAAASMQAACEGDVYVVLGASEWPQLDAVLREEGFHWSATIIWVKDVFVLGRSKYHRRYEPIWYGWHQGGKSSFGASRDQDDIWEIPRPRRSDEHPTMKPISLCELAIKNSSEPGDVVLDLFGGSGSTLLAAQQLERRCFMMELEPRYCDVIIARWEKMTGGKAVKI